MTNGSFSLVAYRFPEDGQYIEGAGTADLLQSLTWGRAPGICRLGTGMVVTVDHRNTSETPLRLILWQVTPSGSHFVLLDDVGSVVESFSKVANCPASTNLVVTALKDRENNLRLIIWRLRGKLMQGFRPDGVKQLFKIDPKAVRGSTGFEDDPEEE